VDLTGIDEISDISPQPELVAPKALAALKKMLT
jgi:hypothetical protein